MNCTSCKFSAINLTNQSDGNLVCRKTPPSVAAIAIPTHLGIGVQLLTTWPKVMETDYCHEYHMTMKVKLS